WLTSLIATGSGLVGLKLLQADVPWNPLPLVGLGFVMVGPPLLALATAGIARISGMRHAARGALVVFAAVSLMWGLFVWVGVFGGWHG
ncbi:MAG: hypothetical protein LC723_07160, partial [Actinobacteria bacterium]|nr:hypothetical protein [Actinomycetota bacterium]